MTAAFREDVRSRRWTAPTSGVLPDVAQANLVVLPSAWADEFAAFCAANARACPVVDRTAPGDPHPRMAAPDADLRTDVPRYRVFAEGQLLAEPTDVTDWWREDLVAFLLGCSFTFERALVAEGLPLRHVEQGRNVPMFVTNRTCSSTDRLAGPLVVSMRPMPQSRVEDAARVTTPYRLAHGAPVHAGDPARLGIRDLQRPDFGDAVEMRTGEVAVFWACGVTPQVVLAAARPPLMITHAPGHMFVTDLPHSALIVGRQDARPISREL